MPKKDGFTVVKEILSKNLKVKIVLITASDDKKIIQHCLNLVFHPTFQNHLTLTVY